MQLLRLLRGDGDEILNDVSPNRSISSQSQDGHARPISLVPTLSRTLPRLQSFPPDPDTSCSRNHAMSSPSIAGELISSSRPQSTPPSDSYSIGDHPEVARPYSKREREACLERYRRKRANRKPEGYIRYAVRKQLADARPRVKGRFAKRSCPTHPYAMPPHRPTSAFSRTPFNSAPLEAWDDLSVDMIDWSS